MPNLEQRAAQAAERAKEPPPVYGALEAYTPNLQAALPTGFPGGVQRFARIVRTAVSANPKLLECDPRSVVACAIQAAQLGLTPQLMGQCWLIPRRNKKRNGQLEATFQIGYLGLIDLAARSGVTVRCDTVRQGDHFLEEGGLHPVLEHVKAGRFDDRAPAKTRGPSFLWYAIAESPDWVSPRFASLDRPEVEKFRALSGDPDGDIWTKWYDEMAMSKAARVALRYVRLSPEFERAMRADDQIIDLEEVLSYGDPDPESVPQDETPGKQHITESSTQSGAAVTE